MLDVESLPLGRQLAVERNARRITQQRIARRAGLSEVYLSKLETGRRPVSPELARRIRAAIEIETN